MVNRGVIKNLPADGGGRGAGDGGRRRHSSDLGFGPLPEPIAKLLTTQVNVQELAVEAAVHASKELALRALRIDPVINSASAAVKLLDELWEVNRPYIRPCV